MLYFHDDFSVIWQGFWNFEFEKMVVTGLTSIAIWEWALQLEPSKPKLQNWITNRLASMKAAEAAEATIIKRD